MKTTPHTLRGAHFHESLLLDTYPSLSRPTEVVKRGRNAVFLERRNEKIAHRYYYKMYVLGIKSWEEVISQLANEFDLCPATLVNILTQLVHDFIRELLDEKPDVKELRKRYPYLVW